jgi:hypothetical protein
MQSIRLKATNRRLPMPYIVIRTTEELSESQREAVKVELGDKISVIPGKSERGLMIEFVTGCDIYLSGVKDPATYVHVFVNNVQPPEPLQAFTKELCHVLGRAQKVPAERIYVLYQTVTDWHVGSMFE